ncbi:hypothetical protein AX15_004353 [Amanita polypyramis BW_CC]|nr:hypothetical protein AX15_004353 [Amanita polypyramis BW_CC]
MLAGMCARALFRPPPLLFAPCRRLYASGTLSNHGLHPYRLRLTIEVGRSPYARLYATQTPPSSQTSPPTQSSSALPPAKSPNVKFSLVSLASVFRKGPQGTSSFKKIVALAKPERKPLLIAIGLLLVSSAISMTIPLTIGKLIDFFSKPNPQVPLGLNIWQACAILFALFTVGGFANAGRAMIMRLSGQRIVARLRERLYSTALKQEVEYVERGEGDVLSRLSVDTSIVGESVTQNLSDGLRAIVMSSVGLGAMFYISPHLTMLMLTIVPPVSLGAVFYGRYLKKLSNQTQEAIGDMTKVSNEALSALRTVQAFNAQPQEELKFKEKVQNVLQFGRKEAIASGIFFGSTGWSGNVTVLGLLGYGGTLVSQGAISVGELMSLLLYTGYVGSGLQMLTSFFTSIMRGVGAGTRIFELLDRQPLVSYNGGVVVSADRRGPIRFEHVDFEYPSRKAVKILKDFNLDIGIGESVALVGKSGGGKSSVHSLLLRYYDPIQGKVTYDGQDIREFSVTSWRSIIGVVPQDPVLFTGTIASNIAYGYPETTREQIENAAREANCDFIWGLPDGFDTQIGRTSLSGGQRQRLAIARALLKKPAILALDEATSSLDATSERRVRCVVVQVKHSVIFPQVNDAIDRILRGRQTTCLFVAHRLSTIARAERVVVLEGLHFVRLQNFLIDCLIDGRITESGTYRELIGRPDSRFRALMAAQLTATIAEPEELGVAPSSTTEDLKRQAQASAL